MKLFIYDWSCEIIKSTTLIRIFGITEDNELVCCEIDDFLPNVYIEYIGSPLKDDVIRSNFQKFLNRKIINKIQNDVAIKGWEKKMRRPLYYANKGYKPYYKCSFMNNREFRRMEYACNS